MNKRLANSLMLAPLIGMADTLPKALSFFGLSALVSSAQVLLQAFALPLFQQLGLYLALISLQCVVLEYSGFFDAGRGKIRLQLFGLFGALLLSMGWLRDLANTTLMPAGFILLGLLLAGLQAWAHYSKSR